MGLLALLPFFLLAICARSELLAIDFDHINDVDPDNVPAFHQRDFVDMLLREDKRRSILDHSGFFRLHGVPDSNGLHHEFLVKPAMQNTFQV